MTSRLETGKSVTFFYSVVTGGELESFERDKRKIALLHAAVDSCCALQTIFGLCITKKT